VLELLRQAGITADPKKCSVGRTVSGLPLGLWAGRASGAEDCMVVLAGLQGSAAAGHH